MVYKETLSNNHGDEMHSERVIFDAVIYNKRVYLRKLLKKGASPNVFDTHGRTPLMLTNYIENESNRTHMVKLLLNYKADVDLRDDNGMTALMHACRCGRSEIVKRLLFIAAPNLDLNMRDNQGLSVLYHAVISENVECVKYLAEMHRRFGVSIDKFTTKDGVTCYMEARRRGLKSICEVLEMHGASKFREDNFGNSILELEDDLTKVKIRKTTKRIPKLKFNDDYIDHFSSDSVSSPTLKKIKTRKDNFQFKKSSNFTLQLTDIVNEGKLEADHEDSNVNNQWSLLHEMLKDKSEDIKPNYSNVKTAITQNEQMELTSRRNVTNRKFNQRQENYVIRSHGYHMPAHFGVRIPTQLNEQLNLRREPTFVGKLRQLQLMT